jgi:hypothetical protein
MTEYHPPLTGVKYRFGEEIAREAQKSSCKEGLPREKATFLRIKSPATHRHSKKLDGNLKAA